MQKYPGLLERFLDYVKTETRSNPNSNTIPSTATQTVFLKKLAQELEQIGLKNSEYHEDNGYVTAVLPANIDTNVPKIGLLAHVDTADFNAVGVSPQIIENYDGKSTISLGSSGEFKLNPAEFPSLKNYKGQTLITTDGNTLLGSDDKSGVAEIMTAMAYLVAHPEVKHGTFKVAFGPDEEIGTGADHFNAKRFDVDFAYTVDGGPVGQLEFETFSAAELKVHIQGKNVHPSGAKNIMINALQVAVDFQNGLPQHDVPEKTEGREGFYHLVSLNGTVEEAEMEYIIRDFERLGLKTRKEQVLKLATTLNQKYGEGRVVVDMHDQYYNMIDVIKDHMEVVELAERAMKSLGIQPDEEAVRGGTDGSKISFMGIPTPNLFAGGENMHGRYEYVALESMEKSVDVILKINELNVD